MSRTYTVLLCLEDVEADDQFEAAEHALDLIEVAEVRKTIVVDEVRSQ